MSNLSNNNTNNNNAQQILRQNTTNAAPINTHQNLHAVTQSSLWEQDANGPQELSAFSQAEGIVKEFNEDQSVNLKSRTRRKMVQRTKRKNYAEARQKVGQNQQNTTNPNPGVNQPVTVGDIKKLLNKTFDFMSYTDDKTFLEIYDGAYHNLTVLDSINTKVSAMTAQDYETLKGQYGDDLPPLEELKEKGRMYAACKKHYEYKLKLISNPFYTVLQNRDTVYMSIDELTRQRDKCRAEHRDKLADYLDTTIELKKLADDGADRDIDRSDLATGYRKSIGGGTYKHHKGYFEAGTVKGNIGTSSGSHAGIVDGGKKITKDLNGRHKAKEEGEKSIGLTLGIGADASLKARAAKGSYKYKNDFFDFGANASVGRAVVSGGIGGAAGYSQKEGGQLYAKGGLRGEGQIFKSRIKAGLHFKDWIAGALKLKAKGGEVWADASAKAGLFKLHEEDASEAFGVYAGGSFGASLASTVVSGSLSIKGVKISIGATGQLGAVGGEASAYATTGGVGASFGLLAGLGFNLKLDIDYSVFTNWLLNKGISKVRNKYKI